MIQKRFVALLVWLAVLCPFAAGASHNFDNETLRYRVLFKWGLINKTAGYATIRMLPGSGEMCTAELTAASEPWADKFYKVRDTLVSVMRRADYTPHYYEKNAHEGSDRKHDIVRFTRQGNTYTGSCVRKVWKKGELTRDETRELVAEGATVDMMSSFYHMRNLPFDKWEKGHTVSLNIFSGKQKELLTFKFQGVEMVEVDGKNYPCYHITFIFTGKNKKKTSDNMDAWITANSKRVPMRLEGKLPVGKVQCELVTGKK